MIGKDRLDARLAEAGHGGRRVGQFGAAQAAGAVLRASSGTKVHTHKKGGSNDSSERESMH